MRTLVLLLCLATPAVAGMRSGRQIRNHMETGPNMQWYWMGPGPAVPGVHSPRPRYDPRSGVYTNHDGSIAAYPARIDHFRTEYVYPGR